MQKGIGQPATTATPAVGTAHMPIGFRVDEAQTETFPVIAPPSMKQDKVDDRQRPQRGDGSADDVQARIDANAAAIPCPPWCVVKHEGDRDRSERADALRECSSTETLLPTLTHHSISAEAVRSVDLQYGEVRPAEIRINDDTMTPAVALRLAEQIREAVAAATGQPATAPAGQIRPGCAPWCADAREATNCGGECSAEPVEVLATGGFIQYRERGGVTVPLAETNVLITEAGAAVVHIRLSGPTDLDNQRDAWADLTPAEARRYAAAILAQAELAEQVQR